MLKFTSSEIRDIIISAVAISFIFAHVLRGGNLINTISFMPATFLMVGLGFVLHELAHKYVAIRYGYWAEYKMWIQGLIFALAIVFLTGFAFIAPGAVYIHGNYIKTSENGKISLAGPLTNIILASVFLLLLPLFSDLEIMHFAILGAIVNSFLAVFNLIPFGMFDGAKIFRWNPLIWIAAMATALILWAKSSGII
ncbi:MAG: site-2 protease family protein [Methanobacteriaceae archaeon]|jgi:Zn-dependent protease